MMMARNDYDRSEFVIVPHISMHIPTIQYVESLDHIEAYTYMYILIL